MNKQENKLALSVLTTLISGIALIYTLIMYHDIIFAVMVMSLIFLICAYILTQNVIAVNIAKNNVINNQLKEYINDISEQLETMNGTQTQLGKATFLYTRQTAQAVATLENNYIESQEALYKNLSSISNVQNKATKLMIKYDQSNTTKVISTIKELRNQLSDTMIQGFDHLQPNNTEVIEALEYIVNYLKSQPAVPDQTLSIQLNNVAHELQNISNNIQHFQIPVQNVVQAPPVQPITPVISETITEPDIQTTEPIVPTEELNETIPESLDDSLTNDDIDTLFQATPVVEETAETVIAEDQPIDNSLVQETVSIEPITDNPNKQLSADEIAALFAAAEPSPKKDTVTEVEEKKTFTPTFTVVGKSDEYKEEPMTIGNLSEDPNKQLSADEIAALFAAADPAPKKEAKAMEISPEPTISEAPDKQLSADEIAALFAAAEPTPKKDTSDEGRRMDKALADTTPEPITVTPVSDNPNKQLSADEIAALFASMG